MTISDNNRISSSEKNASWLEKTGILSIDFYRQIFDSLSASLAVIDTQGNILKTNQAWIGFGQMHKLDPPDTVGFNYFDICEKAQKAKDESANAAKWVATGIQNIIEGYMNEFNYEYHCWCSIHKKQTYFHMRCFPITFSGLFRLIIIHEDITKYKLNEYRLNESQKELKKCKQIANENQIALKSVLEQFENDRKRMEKVVLSNVKTLILPHLQQLKAIKSTHGAISVERLIRLIESGLENLVSPFLHRLNNVQTFLTPHEIQIADMVKHGMATKDIANLLSLSPATVNFHRRNLRSKLGLTNTHTNLRTYLLSLDD